MILLHLSTAFAYQLMGADWTWQSAPLEYPVVIDIDSFPSDVDEDDVEDNVLDALATWSNTGAHFDVGYGGFSSSPTGVIRIRYSSSTSGGVLAEARRIPLGDELRACSIEIFDSNDDFPAIPWSYDLNENLLGNNEVDFQSVVVHELGHCFGLNHSGYTNAIMYATTATGVPVRDMHNDDESGLVAIYGGQASGGSCSTAGSRPAGLFVLVLGLLAARRRI